MGLWNLCHRIPKRKEAVRYASTVGCCGGGRSACAPTVNGCANRPPNCCATPRLPWERSTLLEPRYRVRVGGRHELLSAWFPCSCSGVRDRRAILRVPGPHALSIGCKESILKKRMGTAVHSTGCPYDRHHLIAFSYT